MPSSSSKQLHNKQMTLLVSILAFETYWAYYSMSNSIAYEKEVKDSAKFLLKNIDGLAKLDKGIVDKEALNYHEVKTGFSIEDTLKDLRDWAEGNAEVPFTTFMQSKVFLFFLFAAQKHYLAKHLGLSKFPPITFSSVEFEHTELYQRWQPHLPRASMYWYSDSFDVLKLSESQTIVIYGDIRRSQDLMIYTIGHKRFEDMMIRFFESIRDLFDKNLGIFDKFTGDGFLGYFNEYLCRERRKDFVECFLKFSRQCLEITESLFNEWKRYVRKLPDQDIMLSMGADVGEIYFGDRHGHLVCIGDVIVWAQRMCSAAPASSIYVNNLLANLLADREDIELLPITGSTKTGETFRASKLILTR